MMRQAALVLLSLMLGSGTLSAQEDLPRLIARIQPAVVTVIIFDHRGRVAATPGHGLSPQADDTFTAEAGGAVII